MKTTDRVIAAILFAVAGLPVLWAVFAKFEAISISAISQPPQLTPYAVAYFAWWLRLLGMFQLGGATALTSPVKTRSLHIFLAIVGIAGCVWLESSAYFEVKRIVPVGTAVAPYVCIFLLGYVLQRSSNHSQRPPAAP